MSLKSKKILIISDTHLTQRFNKRKFDYLYKIINSSDQVVINGDFWDFWYTDFHGFIRSKWNQLFPLLLEKKCIYVHGNHDPKNKCDLHVKLFSITAVNNYEMQLDNQIIHFQHGHAPLKAKRGLLIRIYSAFLVNCEKYNLKFIFKILSTTERLGYLFFSKKIRNSKFAKNQNNKLKSVNTDGWLVCGDTHCPEVDNDKNFANSGFILGGHASYIIIQNGQFKLFIDRY